MELVLGGHVGVETGTAKQPARRGRQPLEHAQKSPSPWFPTPPPMAATSRFQLFVFLGQALSASRCELVELRTAVVVRRAPLEGE